MTLRKLSTVLLLIAANSFTFAQSADLASNNSTKPLLVEKTVKSPSKIGADTTKKTSVGAVKAVSKSAATQPKDAKATPSVSTPKDSSRRVATAPVSQPKDVKLTPSVSAKKDSLSRKIVSVVNPVSDVATVRNATILNGDKDDFSPTFFENGLLYCSNSRKSAKKADKSSIVDDLNLKFATFDSLGSLSKPSAFSRRTNSKTHEGPSSFSLNGDTMFLTRVMSKGGVAKENKNGETTLKIYIKIRDKEGNFMGEEVMPFESETYSYCHPTLSADGQRLYFSSNMPGGFGGMDLWMARKLKTGGWSQAMNLGSRINTAGNELFPHLTMNNGLYFSSNGRKDNKGGLDLYRVDIDSKTARPFPLSAAFNTEGDDFGIMFLPNNERKGYFSSNRKGGSGGDDIYEFEFK